MDTVIPHKCYNFVVHNQKQTEYGQYTDYIQHTDQKKGKV